MKILAVDPDTNTIGFAYGDGTVISAVHCSKLPRKSGDAAVIQICDEIAYIIDEVQVGFDAKPDAIIVESQQIYLKGHVNPQNIIYLAQATGATVAALRAVFPGVSISMPLPQKWKGTVPKRIHHVRTLDHYNWGYNTTNIAVFPNHLPDDLIQLVEIPMSNWSHILDAIAMVRWAATRVEKGLKL